VLAYHFCLQIFEQLAAMTNEVTAEITIAEYQQNVNELWDALMGFEMQLVEQLEVSFARSVVKNHTQHI